jgi:hypothetical protein
VLTAKRRRSLWRHLLHAGTRTTLCDISYPWICMVDVYAVSWTSLLRTSDYWHVLNPVPKLLTRLTQSVTLRNTRGSNLGQNTDYPEGSRGFSLCLQQAYYPFLSSLFHSLLTIIQPIDSVLLTMSLNKGIVGLLKRRFPQMFRQNRSMSLRSVTVSQV